MRDNDQEKDKKPKTKTKEQKEKKKRHTGSSKERRRVQVSQNCLPLTPQNESGLEQRKGKAKGKEEKGPG